MGNIKLGLNYKQQLPGAFWDSTLSWQRFLTWFGGEKRQICNMATLAR